MKSNTICKHCGAKLAHHITYVITGAKLCPSVSPKQFITKHFEFERR